METQFPTGAGYAGFFLVGFRKNPSQLSQTQRVGTVILKRTYNIHSRTATKEGKLTPVKGKGKEAPPIYVQDQPDNPLINSDFELSEKDFGISEDTTKPACWETDGVTAVLAPGEGVADADEPDLDTALRLTGNSTEGVVAQTVSGNEPLGGRRFLLSLSLKGDTLPARIEGARLEADGHTLCQIDQDLTSAMKLHSKSGVWPTDVQATEMRVVLPIAFDPADRNDTRPVYYDRVQIEERSRRTEWNDTTMLLIENDLASFKPEEDIIVLGFAAVTGQCAVHVEGTTWLQRDVLTDRQKALFGWEPRVGSDREEEAGEFSDDASAYPPEWPISDPIRDPLPGGPPDKRFKNSFYNGYRRDAHLPHGSSDPLTTDLIEIERNGIIDYAFRLYSEAISATVFYHSGSDPDEEGRWQSENLDMNLDTLVIEPDRNRCYVVWRGVWDFDTHPEDSYRRLIVSAEEPSI